MTFPLQGAKGVSCSRLGPEIVSLVDVEGLRPDRGRGFVFPSEESEETQSIESMI